MLIEDQSLDRCFIGFEFIDIYKSKDQQEVFEIVVEIKDDIQIPHHYLIHENLIRVEPIPESNLQKIKSKKNFLKRTIFSNIRGPNGGPKKF